MRISKTIASIAALLVSAALVGCGSEEPGTAPAIDTAKSKAVRDAGASASSVQAKE